jgi:CDP-glucose 4,6-dehydratase
LADARQFSGSWNFGPSPNSTQTVGAVVERVAACWKDELDWCTDDRKHPHEAPRLMLDSTKAANELGWHPRLTFAEAIALTADWYRAARHGESDLRRLTEEQIGSYAGKASPC